MRFVIIFYNKNIHIYKTIGYNQIKINAISKHVDYIPHPQKNFFVDAEYKINFCIFYQ